MANIRRWISMKIAYLYFAYKNPQLIRKTIEHLSGDDASFYIHIDSKHDIAPFSSIPGDNVFFTKERLPVYWAEYSGIEAILLLMRQALAAPKHHDYLVLLSGSEYPLRSRKYIHEFFGANRGLEFMTAVKVPAPGKPVSRLNTVRYPSTSPIRRFIFRALAKVSLAGRDHRKYLKHFEPYSGLTWWALTREACQYLVETMEREEALTRFFRLTFAPEETVFHTILGNSRFKNRLRRNLLYEDWKAEGAHPEMINERHIAFFESQDKVSLEDGHGPGELLFARKFSDGDLQLIQRIEEMISRKEKQQTASALRFAI
jgi:hypothetical protein